MNSQPLWVVGAPRSGTTFLGAVLNRHPMVTLTNESRVFVLMKKVIEEDCAKPDLVDVEHRERFTGFLKREAGPLIERYYRQVLGADTPIWGDKHPPYADPAVLSGRQGARPVLPVSGSCLRLIREVIPASKFIHIHREPEQVARSLRGRGWVASLADGMAVWRQYVREIDEFFGEIESRKRLVVAYADLLEEPERTADALARFLELSDASPIASFLKAQHQTPTPFSTPVRDLEAVYAAGATQQQAFPELRAS
jgi:hypothetical protein